MDCFEIIDHTADWAIRVMGRDLPNLFVQAALGMSSLLVNDLSSVPLDTVLQFDLEASDVETLLVDWLSELAFHAEVKQLVFREFEVQEATTSQLRVIARGGLAPALQKHVKAVTYHDLEIISNDGGMEATIVFDV